MGGLFQDIAEFFTGNKAAQGEEEAKQARLAAQADLTALQQSGKRTTEAGEKNTAAGVEGVNQASGQIGNEADYASQQARELNQNAENIASNQAATSSTAAARQALMAARASGLNRGQASLRAAGSAGDAYTNQYQAGLQNAQNRAVTQQNLALQGRGAQGNLQQGVANTGLQQQGLGLQTQTGALASKAGYDAQAAAQANASGAAGGSFISGILKSDENCKDNIRPSNDIQSLVDKINGKSSVTPLEDLVAKVRPVDFNYKKDSGEDPNKDRVGVLAQDLEKTSMKDNVIDTPEGKQVDIGQQTLSNTNLIVQLAQELMLLKDELKKAKGGK